LSTATLKYVVNEIGADRFLFSVGYPYETIENGCGWWDNDSKAIQVAVGGVDAYCRIRRKSSWALSTTRMLLSTKTYTDGIRLVVVTNLSLSLSLWIFRTLA
jgi:hypothetical protein